MIYPVFFCIYWLFMVIQALHRLAKGMWRLWWSFIIFIHFRREVPDSKLREQGKLGGNHPFVEKFPAIIYQYSSVFSTKLLGGWATSLKKSCSMRIIIPFVWGFQATKQCGKCFMAATSRLAATWKFRSANVSTGVNKSTTNLDLLLKWLWAGHSRFVELQTCCTVTGGLGLNRLQDLIEGRGGVSTMKWWFAAKMAPPIKSKGVS